MGMTIAGQDVSRETYEQLQQLSDLVQKWTKKINLISPTTISDIWERHITDSAQIYPLAPENFRKWVDIGSGGGFPGLVVAILAKAKNPQATFVLLESDQRKCTFLRTVIRELDLNASVIATRIEDAPPQLADIVSARALTSLSALMPYLETHLSPTGQALLHKGKRHAEEIAEARQSWFFDLEDHQSLTDPDGRLLVIKGIRRVG